MFTGIITHLGTVDGLDSKSGVLTLTLPPDLILEPGESLAVNGVCLTATGPFSQRFAADLSPETLRRTALGKLRPGQRVNLERACRVGQPLGGHFVQGHVDTVGALREVRDEASAKVFTFAVAPSWDRYLVEKGSVAVDGISLTTYDVEQGRFCVAVVPHTLAQTNLGARVPGDAVNVEFDVLGKYTEKLLRSQRQPEGG